MGRPVGRHGKSYGMLIVSSVAHAKSSSVAQSIDDKKSSSVAHAVRD